MRGAGQEEPLARSLRARGSFVVTLVEVRAWLLRSEEEQTYSVIMIVNLLALWEEFRSLRGRFGLFGVATPCRAAHEIGKFLPMKRANLQTGSIIMILPFGGSFTDTSVCFFK